MSTTPPTTSTNDINDKPKSSSSACVLLETSMGDLVIDLDCEGSPRLVQNFIKLCKSRYYTKNLIHTVVLPGRFLVTGDATGTGTGGASIYALLEYYKNNKNNNDDNNNNDSKDREVHLRKSAHRFLKSTGQRRLSREECKEKGRVVALELNGVADTVGSQFLITTAAGENKALDGYSFATSSQNDDAAEGSSSFLSLGRVVEDESNILDRMATTMYCDDNGRPYADVRIHRALIVHDPFEDPPGLSDLLKHQGVVYNDNDSCLDDEIVLRSPSPERPEQEEVPVRIPMEQVLEEMNHAAGGGADGISAYYDDPERERARMEELARQADRSRAVVLEMLGDLPSADIKAPENVLFVCKLNSITTDEDLELIFSRFDPQVKVEIIRDVDTGQSLQYAFCEFTTKEQAAQAYFKMDNALVDDRRIKVDFSQSVAKMWDRYNQRIRQPSAAARQGGHGGGGHGGGKRGGWPPSRQQQQQSQQQRRGPPQNSGPPPSKRYNQTGNNDRHHFARDNQNSQQTRVEGDGRENVTTDDHHRMKMPETRRENPHNRGSQHRSSTSSRDEGSHRRSREDNNDHGDRRHHRRDSRERVDERRERGNGESRHYHGGGRNGDDDEGRDGQNSNSRDSRGKDRPEHRHRDERWRQSRREGEEDSLDSRGHAKRREHKKDRRNRDDEKLKDRRRRRDERGRRHDDDHSSIHSERRSKRRHPRDGRSSDDDDSSRRRNKKKHRHEEGRHKERGHRHKDRHHGHESRRHRRDDAGYYNEEDRPRKRDAHRDTDDDQSDTNKSSRERNRTRDDDGSRQRQHSREERSRDRHDDDDDPENRERKRRHDRSPMQEGNDKDGESHERHRDRKHHGRSKSSHSKK